MKKRILSMLLALVMALSLCACGDDAKADNGNKPTTEIAETTEATEPVTEAETELVTEPEETTTEEVTEPEPEPVNYAEILPEMLQGCWYGSLGDDGIMFYSFKLDNIEVNVLNRGRGAATFFSGKYTVNDDGSISYDVFGVTGSIYYTYENDVLNLIDGNGDNVEKITFSELMKILNEEYSAGNTKGVICLADMIVNYCDGEDVSEASAKKDAAIASIIEKGKAAFKNLTTEYDKVNKVTWYLHKNQPKYVNTCCYIYPYICNFASGETVLRVKLDYTDAQTDAGWVFYDTVIFSVDGENTTKKFKYGEVNRDNGSGDVWEIADFMAEGFDFTLLRSIANSNETIIRFQGSKYHYDHVVTQKEKNAIVDVLAAYDYMTSDYYEG